VKALEQTEKENERLKKASWKKEVEIMELRERIKELEAEIRTSKQNHKNNQRQYR